MANKDFQVRNGLVVSGGKIAVNTESANYSIHISANDAIKIPVGNTGQRPANSDGLIRINSQLGKFEWQYSNSWVSPVTPDINVLAGGIATGGGALTANVTITVPEANTSQYRSAAADLVIAPDVAWNSANFVALSDGANVAVDFSTGFNFTLSLGGNRNLDNPTNTKPGQCGVIVITHSNRSLSFSSNWKFPGGEAPDLSSGTGVIDILNYFVVNSTFIYASMNNEVV